MIEYVKFTEDTAKNREELRQGVQFVKCIYAGPLHVGPLIENRLPLAEMFQQMDQQKFGGVELYDNGRANIYVLSLLNQSQVAVGFFRYTPLIPNHFWMWNEEGNPTGLAPLTPEDKAVHELLKQESNITMFTGYQMYELECVARDAYRAGRASWV